MFKRGRFDKPIISSDVLSKPPEGDRSVCLRCGGSGKAQAFFRGKWKQLECERCAGEGHIIVLSI